jgi:DNA-binding Xre family transcriptional regulator
MYKNEVESVGANYNKLFKLLIDKRMKKGDLCKAASISQSTLAKLGNGENVNTNVLFRICKVLGCDFGDIMEVDQNAPASKSENWRQA